MKSNERFSLTIRPAVSYAFLKIFHLLLAALFFCGLGWLLLPAFIFIGILFSGIALYRFLQTRAILYHLTEETLEVQTGILFKRTDHLELYRVKDYVVTQNPLMQALGLMNLELITTDKTNIILVLKGIPYSDLVEIIRERVQKARQHNNIVELN
jgi:uncharacterized membrane protein YdbT with pleckstrin-like domain